MHGPKATDRDVFGCCRELTTRVVDQGVDSAEIIEHPPDEGCDLLLIANVTGRREALPSTSDDLFANGDQRFLAASADRDSIATGRQSDSGGSPDPGSATGDHHDRLGLDDVLHLFTLSGGAVPAQPHAAVDAGRTSRVGRVRAMNAEPLATVRVASRGPLRGRLRVPGDKSVSHRALILAGLATGRSTITGLSAGLDVLHTRQIMQAMGVRIDEADDCRDGHPVGTLSVVGGELSEPQSVLDVGNSGTAARLLAGVCAGQPFTSVITGDQSIAGRPMDRVVEPLRAMGATIDGRDDGRFTPLTITGGALRGIDYSPPVASAQVKSALLLAGLFAEGATIVREAVTTRRHTEEMLGDHGVDVTTLTTEDGGSIVTLHPGPVSAGTFVVPGDPSQAAFWICAAAAIPGSDVTIENLYLSPERTGFLRVLQRMGADLDVDPAASEIRVVGAELTGTVVTPSELPDLIDEVPALSIAGVLATSGALTFEGAGELRAKESDRIETVAALIQALGGSVSTGPETLAVSASTLRAGGVESHHDHRIAMAAAVAACGLAGDGEIEIAGWDAVATSYPGFLDDLERLTMST